MSYQKKAWLLRWSDASQAFFWYDIDKYLKTHSSAMRLIIHARHEKTDLKVFVVVTPKEGLAGWGPAHPSLDMTRTMKYYSTALLDYIL